MGNEGSGTSYNPTHSNSNPGGINNKIPTYDFFREQPLDQNPIGIDNFDNQLMIDIK